MSRPRIGHKQLAQLRTDLSDRDIEILTSLAENRFLTSNQVRRLHFADRPTEQAAMRSTNRALAKLDKFDLVDSMERRIGGSCAGSGASVWSLAPAGGRLLMAEGLLQERAKWLRERDPSRNLLAHSLAIAEVCLALSEAERRCELTVLELRREPESWRAYSRSGGGVARLKPDLSAVTASGEFEDHWFLEVDLATEQPHRVISACLNYEAYRRSGAEQKRLGLFPGVVWIVPSLRRKTVLTERLTSDSRLTTGLFAVILLEELIPLMKAGIEQQETGHGA